jgi:hypothetical protein
MKHSNDGGVLRGAHEYKNGSYQEVKDFVPSKYPKHVAKPNGPTKVVKNVEEEKAFLGEDYKEEAEAPKEA